MVNGNKIATLDTPDAWKVNSAVAAFLAGAGGVFTLAVTLILLFMDVIELPQVCIATIGAAVGMPTIGAILGMWGAHSDRVNAKGDIEEALKGLADPSFAPTKEQYKLLFRDGTPIPFEVNGSSGAKIKRSAERSWDPKSNLELPPSYSFDIDVDGSHDDGIDNFDRMLTRAIEDNADIKAAVARA